MLYDAGNHDGIEQFVINDRDGDPWAVLTYFSPRETPGFRYRTWVVDFRNGDRLTGEPATEVARLLMNDQETEGSYGEAFDRDVQETILDTVVYDDDSGAYAIDVRGVRVWFYGVADQGSDVVLYAVDSEGGERGERAGVLQDPPFEADDLEAAMEMERRR